MFIKLRSQKLQLETLTVEKPKLDTIINVIVPAKRWQWGRGGGLLANAFLTVAKRRLLKVAMTRVLFD